MKWDGFPGHLSQVIINWFQNSIRYAYPEGQGGEIDVRIERVADDWEATLRIVVRDYGPVPFCETAIQRSGIRSNIRM